MHQFHMIEDYVAGHYATTCTGSNPVDAAKQVFKFRQEYRRLLEEELKKKRKKEEEEEKKRKEEEEEKKRKEEEKKARVARVKKDQYVNKRKNRTNVLSVPCPKCGSGIGETWGCH